MTLKEFLAYAGKYGAKRQSHKKKLIGPRGEAWVQFLHRDNFHAQLPEIEDEDEIDDFVVRGLCNQLRIPVPDGVLQRVEASFRQL